MAHTGNHSDEQPSGHTARSRPSQTLVALIDALHDVSLVALWCVCLALILFIGLGDYATGPDLTFGVFYLAPLFVISARARYRASLFASLLCVLAWYLADVTTRSFASPAIPMWNGVARFVILGAVASLIVMLRDVVAEERETARVDPLTGLANARALFEAGDAELRRMRRTGRTLSIGYFDIDDFKIVNDTLGHSVGDEVLSTVAATIAGNVRAIDTAARIGGDEFVVLLPETDEKAARLAVERMYTSLMDATSDRGWPIGFSVGVATYTSAPVHIAQGIAAADALMYRRKRSGKHGIECATVDGAAPLIDRSTGRRSRTD